MRFRTATAAVGLAVVLGAAACSSDDDNPTIDAGADTSAEIGNGGTQDTPEADHNEADVTFVQMMIPHHEGAVEMAQLAIDKAESPEVVELAERIEAAQAPEIEEMTAWLEAWGEPVETEGMDHGEMAGMSEDDMAALESASGPEFDRMFLEMMIEHHRGAVEMAETEIADGVNPEAIAMAETIKSSQEAEIAEMEELLDQLGA